MSTTDRAEDPGSIAKDRGGLDIFFIEEGPDHFEAVLIAMDDESTYDDEPRYDERSSGSEVGNQQVPFNFDSAMFRKVRAEIVEPRKEVHLNLFLGDDLDSRNFR